MHPRKTTVGAALVLSVLSGCKEEKKQSGEQPAGSAESKQSSVDPAVAQALAAVSANPAAAKQTQPGGPPENGVFAPGAADQEKPKGGAPKITMGSDGTEPRLTLGSSKGSAGSKGRPGRSLTDLRSMLG